MKTPYTGDGNDYFQIQSTWGALLAVPVTQLLGILGISPDISNFWLRCITCAGDGFAKCSSAILILQHTFRFGDVMRGNYLHDIFGIGDQVIFTAFYQNIGNTVTLSLGALAAFELASSRQSCKRVIRAPRRRDVAPSSTELSELRTIRSSSSVSFGIARSTNPR
jgi:hypothetical protein